MPCMSFRCPLPYEFDPVGVALFLVVSDVWHQAFLQVFGQILFSGSLFLFWLVYADGMNSAGKERYFCSFYFPKLFLVCTYVGVAATMFVLHGRVPDRINMADVSGVIPKKRNVAKC